MPRICPSYVPVGTQLESEALQRRWMLTQLALPTSAGTAHPIPSVGLQRTALRDLPAINDERLFSSRIDQRPRGGVTTGHVQGTNDIAGSSKHSGRDETRARWMAELGPSRQRAGGSRTHALWRPAIHTALRHSPPLGGDAARLPCHTRPVTSE
jgi:hypothetical protein